MKSKLIWLGRLTAISGVCGAASIMTGNTVAQEAIPLPVIPAVEIQQIPAVPIRVEGFALPAIEPAQIVVRGGVGGQAGVFSSSVSVSESDGVKTTTVNENGREFVIKEGADSLEVTFSKEYGPDNLDALKRDHPDLHMHVVSFPQESQGSKVVLKVAVQTTRKAANAEEMKEKFPDAYAVYEQYGQGFVGARLEKAMPFRVEIGPRIEGVPMRAIRPAPDFFDRFNNLIEEDMPPAPAEPAKPEVKPKRTIKT